MTDKARLSRDQYWRRTRRITAILALLWFGVTFCIVFFARELSGLTLFGWPFSFYMAGQGLTLFYLAIVVIYIKLMQSLDKKIKNGSANVK
jgi:putative solute:sodium symporter small subunit